METASKKYAPKPESIEKAFKNGPMMVFSGARSDEEVRLMSEWAAKRRVELGENASLNADRPLKD